MCFCLYEKKSVLTVAATDRFRDVMVLFFRKLSFFTLTLTLLSSPYIYLFRTHKHIKKCVYVLPFTQTPTHAHTHIPSFNLISAVIISIITHVLQASGRYCSWVLRPTHLFKDGCCYPQSPAESQIHQGTYYMWEKMRDVLIDRSVVFQGLFIYNCRVSFIYHHIEVEEIVWFNFFFQPDE